MIKDKEGNARVEVRFSSPKCLSGFTLGYKIQ